MHVSAQILHTPETDRKGEGDLLQLVYMIACVSHNIAYSANITPSKIELNLYYTNIYIYMNKQNYLSTLTSIVT